MFKLSEIKELIKLVDETSVHELEIENEGTRLLIRKPGKSEIVTVQAPVATPAYAVAPQAVIPNPQVQSDVGLAGEPREYASNLHKIVSPMVGTFYSSSSPDTAPYVSIGSKVGEKTTVCIIEAMKLMNELEAEVKGEIVEILAENGQLVEYGQPLFLVKPE
ncbi:MULTISPECIES: acetyl-CoA carboxylase biotin carboxyl carrier protein [Paenibacillus]|uniref:Biotin carboxyl carrier protein of acetyl-CoA carboxylase n=1 Tax=Paenibacillus polymyxa TaxID=1406 RepID=A0AAJ3IYM2_PAEPO|nr:MULTISPECIES: acetyl-CoA carboxylase biotin carboxyl carrier protein [Paenibacillus]APB75370.1 acetyl-CoA carboxylase biotin carboxyl carrier protein [Paenibacillus polymyxa]MDH2330703.1 acetyl-CoA carboxylase biotin carboxyl carrier protein [Paenibacillus polymyxa]ODA07026.1 acetyl-CoA carboxylase, biotin carboxyl carrier protein [Paenibacillus polymyxa]OME72692.1 acetyl-CoA carboxylase, biotin carboxyl carrier protein [Paenibacillus peoriae]OMF79600.1 acetyl-CoA carboxylase, biotin carbox